MPVKVKNRYKEEINPWGKVVLGAGILGALTGIIGAYTTKKNEKEEG